MEMGTLNFMMVSNLLIHILKVLHFIIFVQVVSLLKRTTLRIAGRNVYVKTMYYTCNVMYYTKVLRVENEEGNMEIHHLIRSIEANADDHGVEIQPEDASQSGENVVTTNDDFNGLPLTSPELDGDCVDIIPGNDAFQKYSNTVNQNVDVKSIQKNADINPNVHQDKEPPSSEVFKNHTHGASLTTRKSINEANDNSRNNPRKPVDENTSCISNSINSCVTKMGQYVKFVLGNTNEVLEFDKSRRRLKEWPNNEDYIESYKDNLAFIETNMNSNNGSENFVSIIIAMLPVTPILLHVQPPSLSWIG